MGKRSLPGGVGSSDQGAVRKNRRPTVIGGQASRVACAQSTRCSSRISGLYWANRWIWVESSKKARIPPSSSTMPVVPASQSSAIRRSSWSGERKRRENKMNSRIQGIQEVEEGGGCAS